MAPNRWANRIQNLQPTAVNRVLAEAQEVQKSGKNMFSLMRGQPDLPTPSHIVEAACLSLRSGRTGYPDNQGELALRQAVAKKLTRDNQLKYDPANEILITDGATAGIAIALGTLLDPGDEVLLPDPIYDAYQSPIALWGGKPVSIPTQIIQNRFTLPLENLEKSWNPKAKILLLNSPWNPVGTVFTQRELEPMMEFAWKKNLYVISDEIYETLVYDGQRGISCATVFPQMRTNLILVNSLSKTYSMTGWRIGYCAGPKEIIQKMLLLWQQMSRGPATFVQDAAAQALMGDQNCVQTMTREFQSRRDLVLSQLQNIPGVIPMVPGGGLFVMVDIRGLQQSSDQVRKFLLYEHGVIVIHGAAYGQGGEGTLRVSFAGGGKNLENALEHLRQGLKLLAHK